MKLQHKISERSANIRKLKEKYNRDSLESTERQVREGLQKNREKYPQKSKSKPVGVYIIIAVLVFWLIVGIAKNDYILILVGIPSVFFCCVAGVPDFRMFHHKDYIEHFSENYAYHKTEDVYRSQLKIIEDRKSDIEFIKTKYEIYFTEEKQINKPLLIDFDNDQTLIIFIGIILYYDFGAKSDATLLNSSSVYASYYAAQRHLFEDIYSWHEQKLLARGYYKKLSDEEQDWLNEII